MAMKLLAILTSSCIGRGNAIYQAYTATLTPLGASAATGEVTIFVTPTGLLGVGKVEDLPEANLQSLSAGGTDCAATNGCGVHVHTGTACTNSTTQGGHFYAESSDPWSPIGYASTNAQGMARFSFSVSTRAINIEGKTFIVHNNAGDRVACGLLSEVLSGFVSSDLSALAGSGVTGKVTIYTASNKIIGAGLADGLEANLKDVSHGGTSCTATNGCGVHVHSGTACTDSTTQGGHYFRGAADPWSLVRYSSTTTAGQASFVFMVEDNAIDVASRPFVVHNDAGGRVACGMLETAPYRAFSAQLEPLGASIARGEVTVLVTPTGLWGAGNVVYLPDSNIMSQVIGGADCTAANGCGVHVHSGDSCSDSATQGGHFYAESSDPWSPIGYVATNAQGATTFSFSVSTSATSIRGKPFIVHDNAGARVACGILSAVSLSDSTSEYLTSNDALSLPTLLGVIAGATIALMLLSYLAMRLYLRSGSQRARGLCTFMCCAGTAPNPTNAEEGDVAAKAQVPNPSPALPRMMQSSAEYSARKTHQHVFPQPTKDEEAHDTDEAGFASFDV